MNPIATSGNIVSPQYLSVDAADQYFYQRLNSEDWLNATPQDKTAALVQSTRAIDNLRYVGVKADPNQLFEFPRWQPSPLDSSSFPTWYDGGYLYYSTTPPYAQVDTTPTPTPVVPQAILIACCENAIVLLGGFDFEIELATLNTEQSIFAGIRETYDRKLAVTHLRAGIASAVAWNHLKPWLADTNSFTLSRVN